jgi:hypothetical protein
MMLPTINKVRSTNIATERLKLISYINKEFWIDLIKPIFLLHRI